MKAYKGFDKDLKCRGFQYEIGKEYTTDTAKLCESGFHACENPLDVLDYYNLCDSRFAEVELDATKEKDKDSKRVGKTIKIQSELKLKGFIDAAISFLFESTNDIKKSRDGAQLASSGDGAKLASSGDRAQLASAGDGAKLASSGDRAQLASAGDGAKLASSGFGAQLASAGDGAKLASSGFGAQLASAGDGAQLASAGDSSVIMIAGHGGKAKARKGSFITLAEWDIIEGMETPIHVVTRKVDGRRIKVNTWYALKNGKFIEVKDE
jgi:hypothetical protein